MRHGRVLAVSVVAGLALAAPSGALAVKQMIAVQNTQAFKGSETHIYSFRAAANALVVANNLASTTLRLNAVTPKGQSGAALTALGTYGCGTLHFVQNGPLNTPSCTGGTKETRRVTRDESSMTFSPTRNAANRYSDALSAARFRRPRGIRSAVRRRPPSATTTRSSALRVGLRRAAGTRVSRPESPSLRRSARPPSASSTCRPRHRSPRRSARFT